jgi:hypothetical protein
MSKKSSYQKLKDRVANLQKQLESKEKDIRLLVLFPKTPEANLLKLSYAHQYKFEKNMDDALWCGDRSKDTKFIGISNIIESVKNNS